MQEEQTPDVTAAKASRIVSMLSVLGGPNTDKKGLTAQNGSIFWNLPGSAVAEIMMTNLMVSGILRGRAMYDGSSMHFDVRDINERNLKNYFERHLKANPQGINRALTMLGTDDTLSLLVQEPQRSTLQKIFVGAREGEKKDGELRRAPTGLVRAVVEAGLTDRIGKNATLRLVAKASSPIP